MFVSVLYVRLMERDGSISPPVGKVLHRYENQVLTRSPKRGKVLRNKEAEIINNVCVISFLTKNGPAKWRYEIMCALLVS